MGEALLLENCGSTTVRLVGERPYVVATEEHNHASEDVLAVATPEGLRLELVEAP